MNRLHFALVIIFSFLSFNAQSQSYKVKGIVEDTLGNALIQSTVLLLEKSDSTLVDYANTSMDGSFRFKDVPAGEHIVKSTYLGYLPLTVDASSTDGSDIDLGILKMTEIAEELMEVVIKAAKAPIKMRGDTIEYDASTFKVPEGSTVEDLLRRLPGIDVESDGSIQADGKTVSQVTVDGKSFFGSDPKAATKNLPAEGISKVQVFDTKTEQEKLTGATSESQDKTMNLELKEEFKRGGFGKVVAGAGETNRKELKGNYNRFNKKIQFSLVGVGNNTGRNGLSWDDYQDFMGSESFNFSSDDSYGFGGGGNRYFYFGGGGGGIEATISSLFFANNRSGLPENYSTGLNFNYDHNKTKVSSVYYFNQNGLLENMVRDQDKFYQNFTQQENMESSRDDVSKGHRLEVEIEKEIDSLHSFKLELKGALIDQNNFYNGNSSLSRDALLTSSSAFSNNTNTKGNLYNGNFFFRKKFMKKGRRMGFNASLLNTELNDDWLQDSETQFFDDQGTVADILKIDQQNESHAEKSVLKLNGIYVEPLSKKFFWQTFYNYSNRNESGDRIVNDITDDNSVLNENLSREYTNTIDLNRIGTSIRYSFNGMNITTGVAYQQFDLKGAFNFIGEQTSTSTVDEKFVNVIPHFSMNFNPIRNAYVSLSYTRSATEPAIADLQPVVDNINPLFIKEGNPALTPEITDYLSTYVSRNFPLAGIRVSLRANLSFFDTQISTEEKVDENLVTTYKPINLEGGNSNRYNASISFPIIKNKITGRARYGYSTNNRPSLVNDILNSTTVKTHSPYIKFNITPSKDFSVYLDFSYDVSHTEYDINSSQDQTTKNTDIGAELNMKLLAGFFISTKMSYSRYINDRFDVDTTIPIWNSSIYRHFMKDNQLEVRLALYDGLNRNMGFNQRAFGNRVFQSSTENLGRYGMLSLTYNIRGMKSDVRKDSWW